MIEGIIIEKFKKDDIEQAKELLDIVISQNFKNNNITDQKEIEAEINAQIKLVYDYFENIATCTSMFGAKLNNKLIGIVAIGNQTPKIKKHIEEKLKNVLEIKNLYILPEYQKQGLGKKLFNVACESLLRDRQKQFMLYSSFKTGQTYWHKMLGKPYRTINENNVTRKIWLQKIKFIEEK